MAKVMAEVAYLKFEASPASLHHNQEKNCLFDLLSNHFWCEREKTSPGPRPSGFRIFVPKKAEKYRMRQKLILVGLQRREFCSGPYGVEGTVKLYEKI